MATNIQDAKLLIQSSRQADRSTGLKDLVHILRHNRGKPSLEALGNKAYLALCETLFQSLRDERSAVLRSKTKAPRNVALLTLSASALRHVIATGVRNIKSSTVEIIIDTIIEVLPDSHGVLVKPLLEELPKTLRCLLEYQPHVERLSKDCWDAAVDFCLKSLTTFFASEPAPEPPNSYSTSVSSRARTPLDPIDLPSSRASPRAPVLRTKLANDEFAHSAEDFVHCLHLLFKASNAPVLDKAEAALAVLLRFLHWRTGRGSAAAGALAAINSILTRTTLPSLELTKRTVQELLPLMKSMWAELILRDAIVITLMYTEAHISSMLADLDNETISFDLEALIETMYGDYRRRQDTTAHQYLEEDHLCFRHLGQPNRDTHPLSTYAFSMEAEHLRFEGLWGTVSTIARFSFMLDERKRKSALAVLDAGQSVSKRPRGTQLFREYLRHVLEPRSNAKRAALQVVAFMVQDGPIDEEDLQSMLEKLTSCISDENPAHSVWAMIALAGAALQHSATHASLKPYWISAWQTASRAVTSLSLCRAACHLVDVLLKLHIVPFSTVSGTVQSMLLSIELSGPTALTETSSSLFTTIMRERVQENPAHFNATSERILSWLLSKWTPGLWSDRVYSSLNANHCNAHDVLRVIHACLDRPFHPAQPCTFLVLGPIAQARMRTMQYKDLAQYLLLLDDRDDDFAAKSPASVPSSEPATEHHPTPMESRVLDYCLSEVDKAKHRWKEATSTGIQGITSDMMRIVTNLCIVAPAVASLGNDVDRRVIALNSSAEELSEAFVTILTKPQIEQYKIDAVLETCTRSLPGISDVSALDPAVFKRAGCYFLALDLSRALGDRREVKQSFYAEDDDFMDVDDAPDSQNASLAGPEVDVPRYDIQAESDAHALRASCTTYLHLIASLPKESEQDRNSIPSSFVDYLVSLPESELLRSRQFLRDLWNSNFQLGRPDCLNLLERCSEALIDPRAREYNTSEVANGMLVEVLIGTALIWGPDATDREAQDLYENVEALYAYYIKGMEKGGVRRSANLQKVIALFLHGLLKHHPDFGQNRKVTSVRTSLFDLLAQGEMTVKHHIAERLPRMFEDFVLSEHRKILQDVDDSLPGDEEGIEGIAVRLLVLSKLASQWHTLLRDCVYRMFATVGSVQGAAQHAKRCMFGVAQSKGLEDSQSLFRLFAPQVIFTWLDRGRLFADIPYVGFGYTTLVELLRDVEAEATGQAIMRGRQEELAFLAEQLETSVPELLSVNLGKAAAYTIAWDTCRGSQRNKADPSYADLLRELVGSDKYKELIRQRFPQVLGYILQTLDHEERIQKALEKKPAFNPAAQVISAITTISHSTQDLTTGIEPSFSAFYLPDQLERLCRRSRDHPTEFWSPSNYTYVMRSLLDRIHPALGSLHARAMIRKVRIVVALAGPVAHEGYPLQMTLQSLRPFLTDAQCAEDTVGIMQYLLQHGAPYLRQHLGFVTGIGLSILISIRVFLGSSQESTTQQSQHVATLNAANRFHVWLSEYLKRHADAIAGSERTSVKAFRLITTAASQVQAEGNSIRGSEESKLLLEILDDVKSGRRLLNKTSREVALNLLCRNFQPASMARDDILGIDRDAAQYAPLVWESCRRNNVGDGYLLWTAKVLGRAYSAYGEVKRSTDQSKPWLLSRYSSKDSLGKSSREAVIKEVIDLFYSDDRTEVSLAENAVRRLISRLESTKPSYSQEVYTAIPDPISKALGLYLPDHGTEATSPPVEKLEKAVSVTATKPLSGWIRDLAMALCRICTEDAMLGALYELLRGIDHMAEKLLPFILHLVLLEEFDTNRKVRDCVSQAMASCFRNCDVPTAPYARIFIQAVLYLRSQPLPREVTRVDRDRWLEIDYLKASQAANVCGMYRSALLFAETSSGQPIVKNSSRRSSVLVEPPRLPSDLQLSIYKSLEEPDSFYGVERDSNLLSVLDRIEYEGDGVKSLLFRGARLDSQMRRSNAFESSDSRGTIKSLVMLNMNSVTHSLLSNDQFRDIGDEVVESTLHTARKLGQWDIKAPEANCTEHSTLFKAFQGLHFARSAAEAKENFERQLFATMGFLSGKSDSSVPARVRLRTLAALTEADDVIRTERSEYLLDTWDRMKSREKWMRAGEFDDVRQLLSCRETLFNVLGGNPVLVDSLRARTATIRNMEVEALISSSTICRRHGALQESLASVTYLSDIVPDCKSVGLDIEATAQHEVANVLWDQGETEISIHMRQHLIEHADFDSQNVDLSLPVLLARLGHHLAEARLAKPDAIMQDYLLPAIRELKNQKQGSGPGQVFHEFALFCDKQLQSPEAAEDLERIKTVMDRKLQEYHEFTKLSKTTDKNSKGMRDTYHRSARRAKGWYDLDHAEYERLRKGREQFLRQCLENYLLSLYASDEYNNDALRVFSLWLEYADTDLANEAVKMYLHSVPSGKFALLMNQLSSRLQAEDTEFQHLLSSLVFRICMDHPYHGMHQIFAIQMKVGAITREDAVRAKDESALSRQKAAAALAKLLSDPTTKSHSCWASLYQSNEIYHHLAMFKGEKESTQQGREIPLARYKESRDLATKVPKLNVPPATLQVEVRASASYSDLPTIQRFRSTMSIANGLSAPKVLTAIGTDGKHYKQLFKSGNDDLRQDAIMEQVFDQVSRLLRNHTATRIRNIGIRTYKVLPLSTRAGLMEFVQNTIPLHLWVMPAHEKYYPNDYKPEKCRKDIGAAQQDTLSTRTKVWQKVADNFHPVLHYFFLERFEDPDEWFERRLAYTRSTAAISILGHVLGLGDRHCHNILLDEKSGEVVHIDLGVSFEAGRVLPVPEVVPFRLTRDLVDAMGYTKTEGVFRRCCEFTMDTLREERESIMTLLNVLRYDPLVNWSITSTKAKRMQEGNQDTNAQNGTRGSTVAPGGTPALSGQAAAEEVVVHESHKKKEREEQAGEAGRALSVVEKKLSKTLSTKATVNELIQQATDERNLAVLYMGWASYA